jgi:hypothetical protein
MMPMGDIWRWEHGDSRAHKLQFCNKPVIAKICQGQAVPGDHFGVWKWTVFAAQATT